MNEQRFMETFAVRLRQGLRYNQRNGKAMTQHALAEATGLHYSIISRYARARRMPSAYHTALIARALNVSAEWLLGIRDEGRDKPWKTDSL